MIFKIIIGLTGPIAGGKGIVADYLDSLGFFRTSLSDRIREEILRRGEEITREKLQNVADELRNTYGPEVLASRTWQVILEKTKDKAVVDSIRGEAEVDFFKKDTDFVLIGVTAPAKLRYGRIKQRRREEDPQSWEEFIEVDKKDLKSGKGKFGRNIGKCLKKADFLIKNTGTPDELIEKTKKILRKIVRQG